MESRLLNKSLLFFVFILNIDNFKELTKMIYVMPKLTPQSHKPGTSKGKPYGCGGKVSKKSKS